MVGALCRVDIEHQQPTSGAQVAGQRRYRAAAIPYVVEGQGRVDKREGLVCTLTELPWAGELHVNRVVARRKLETEGLGGAEGRTFGMLVSATR